MKELISYIQKKLFKLNGYFLVLQGIVTVSWWKYIQGGRFKLVILITLGKLFIDYVKYLKKCCLC